ncbi:MAG: hypothetical protein R3Y57_06310 [Erysipelotrichaceae bacterium]
MKKIVIVLILCLLVGCSSDSAVEIETTVEPTNDITDVEIQHEEQEEIMEESIDEAIDESVKINIDLSILNDTMAYAQLSQMMFDMETYEGKVVKIVGLYDVQYIQGLDKTIYTILIFDATLCCTAYMELDFSAFEEYPSDAGEITLIGTYRIDDFEGNEYPILDVISYQYNT